MCKNTACELLCYVVLQAVINAKAEVTNSFLGHFPWLREWREMALGSTGRFGSWSLLARFRFDPLPLPYTNLSQMRLVNLIDLRHPIGSCSLNGSGSGIGRKI